MASRSKVINTVLNLQSNMAKQMQSITSATRTQQKAMQKLTNDINKFKSKAKEAFTDAAKEAVKFGKKVGTIGFAAIGAAAGLALSKGLSDSMDFEGLRNQLFIATRDQTKAADLFKWSNNFANTTPFGNKEVIDASSQLAMQGLDPKKLIPLLGDMAASKSGKTLDDAVQAQLDAQTGELERLKEFGITKQNIIDEGNKIMKGKQLVNNQGQITDMNNFMVALQSLMKKKYSGAMEAQAKTLKGIWDNTKATLSTALVKIWGMQEDGSIKAGSALEKLKEKATDLMNIVNTAGDGSKIDELQTRLAQVFDYVEQGIPKAINEAKYAWDQLTGAFGWLKENKDWLLPTLEAVVGAFIAMKAVQTVVIIYESWAAITKALTIAQIALATATAATPFGLIATLIGLAVAAGILLYQNWDTIKTKGLAMWAVIKDAFKSSVNFIVDKVNWLIEKINLIPGVKIPIIPKINMSNYDQAAPMLTPNAISKAVTPAQQNFNSPFLPKHALGTTNAPGGPSLVGEHGPEIVNLPKGSTVTNASKTAGMLGGKSVTINLIVQGNMIADDDYVDYLGDKLFKRVQLAMSNV